MKNSSFQTILIAIFSFIGVFAVLIFSGVMPIGDTEKNAMGSVTLWGFVPEYDIRPIVDTFNKEYENQIVLTYVYKDKNNLENELVSALANDEGPDLIIFPQDLIIRQGGKVLPIPFESYSERAFKDTFAEAGEIFLTSKGILSLPLSVDPIVMYWNRDLFSSVGVTTYPKAWVDFLKLPEVLTKRDSKGNIFQSAVALGTYKNISNAKEILSTLLLQAGDEIINLKLNGDGTRSGYYNLAFGIPNTSAISAVHFYTEFANQSRASYSWNSSLPLSKKAFEAGTLAVYFGKASEYRDIKRNNPHLNFDVAIVPQRDAPNVKVTFGDISGISILKSSPNINASVVTAGALSGATYGKMISRAMNIPSARRDILGESDARSEFTVFNGSALISRSWYDPNSIESNNIFKDMIESILSGKDTEISSIDNARDRLTQYVSN